MKLKKYKLILILVVLILGISITGWSISTHSHSDQNFITDEIQKELKNGSQLGNTISGKFSQNSPILFLISTGLIGLVGVRRQRSKIKG